ncbi:MAG: 50S ribosomal protein L11 methyltransferase [Chloroflexi bacterium]|nr:50S ribosomal protein L11 methyltransferase [Chloroflexota bacterium]
MGRSWKKYFKTIEVGSALLIKPSWSTRKPRQNQALVVLDPGLSFGTGQHPTTSFCLRHLVRCRKPGQRQSFWDIGSGSGILAIAAAKLGYAPVRAIDFDPTAVRIAKANAGRNKVGDQVRITRSDLRRLPRVGRERYDVICANLVDDLLISQAGRVSNRLKANGKLILAGILAQQFPSVQRAYAKMGFKLLVSQTEREWRSGVFALRKAFGTTKSEKITRLEMSGTKRSFTRNTLHPAP